MQLGSEFQYTQQANCTWHYQPCLCPAWPQRVPDNIEGPGVGETGGGQPAASGPLTGGTGERNGGEPDRPSGRAETRGRGASGSGTEVWSFSVCSSQAATTAPRTSTLITTRGRACHAVSPSHCPQAPTPHRAPGEPLCPLLLPGTQPDTQGKGSALASPHQTSTLPASGRRAYPGLLRSVGAGQGPPLGSATGSWGVLTISCSDPGAASGRPHQFPPGPSMPTWGVGEGWGAGVPTLPRQLQPPGFLTQALGTQPKALQGLPGGGGGEQGAALLTGPPLAGLLPTTPAPTGDCTHTRGCGDAASSPGSPGSTPWDSAGGWPVSVLRGSSRACRCGGQVHLGRPWGKESGGRAGRPQRPATEHRGASCPAQGARGPSREEGSSPRACGGSCRPHNSSTRVPRRLACHRNYAGHSQHHADPQHWARLPNNTHGPHADA